MKVLLIGSLGLLFVHFLFLNTSSSPSSLKFSIGDCIQLPINEKWEKPSLVRKILSIGKSHYETALFIPNNGWIIGDLTRSTSFFEDSIFKKVECPKE